MVDWVFSIDTRLALPTLAPDRIRKSDDWKVAVVFTRRAIVHSVGLHFGSYILPGSRMAIFVRGTKS